MDRLPDHKRVNPVDRVYNNMLFLQAMTDFLGINTRVKSSHLNMKNYPKHISPSDPLRDLLRKILPQDLALTKEERDATLAFRSKMTIYDQRERVFLTVSPFVNRLARFIVAITGGLSLVIPMLIMRIHDNSTKSLITTSIAVVLFAAVVSVGFAASNAETLGITAAYAAVLVVFVGTSS